MLAAAVPLILRSHVDYPVESTIMLLVVVTQESIPVMITQTALGNVNIVISDSRLEVVSDLLIFVRSRDVFWPYRIPVASSAGASYKNG